MFIILWTAAVVGGVLLGIVVGMSIIDSEMAELDKRTCQDYDYVGDKNDAET